MTTASRTTSHWSWCDARRDGDPPERRTRTFTGGCAVHGDSRKHRQHARAHHPGRDSTDGPTAAERVTGLA